MTLDKARTLADWLPESPLDLHNGERLSRMASARIVEECSMQNASWRRWPGTHRNVLNWVKLDNGYAVGWNENPGRGRSFPIIRLTAD